MAKGNEVLKQQLKSLMISAEKEDVEQQISRQIPTTTKNIKSKLIEVADWYNGNNDSASVITDGMTEPYLSPSSKRRCIVLTILFPENLLKMDSTEVDSVNELKKAIVAFVGRLR